LEGVDGNSAGLLKSSDVNANDGKSA